MHSCSSFQHLICLQRLCRMDVLISSIWRSSILQLIRLWFLGCIHAPQAFFNLSFHFVVCLWYECVEYNHPYVWSKENHSYTMLLTHLHRCILNVQNPKYKLKFLFKPFEPQWDASQQTYEADERPAVWIYVIYTFLLRARGFKQL